MSKTSNNQKRLRLKPLSRRSGSAIVLLAIFGFNLLATFTPFVQLASAADSHKYTVVYSNNDVLALKKAFSDDGGIGDDDLNGVLSRTQLRTTGGRIPGIMSLSITKNISGDNDMPIYTGAYYCSQEGNGVKLSLNSPGEDKVYLKLNMAVALGTGNKEWGDMIGDQSTKNKTVSTYVGFTYDNVGRLHVPANKSASALSSVGSDTTLTGYGGKKYDIETAIPSNDIPAGEALDAFNKLTTAGNCAPTSVGDIGNATVVYNSLAEGDQKAWKSSDSDNPVTSAVNGGTADQKDTPSLSCHAGVNPLNWLICGIIKGLVDFIGVADNVITSEMTVGSEGKADEPSQIFCPSSISPSDTSQSCVAYHEAWRSFRNIALGLLVVAGIIVLMSQALGTELLDAYTIRKVLPRLLIAALGITLSWQLMQFFVRLTNDLGLGIRHLIYAPFVNAQFSNSIDLGSASGAGVTLLGGAGLAVLGIFGLLSFVATAALAVLVAFLILVLRQLVIILLIIIAPVAIVMYILPRTQKTYKLWWESFSKALLMFPLISGLIAVGRVFSAVTATAPGDSTVNALVALIAYFAPYFALPLTFKFAGGALANIGGFMNDRSKGGFDRLRNYRGNQAKKNIQDLKDGNRLKGENIPLYGQAAKRFNEASRGAANLHNAGYNPARMRQRMSTAASAHSTDQAMEALEKNHSVKAIAPDDDLVETALNFERDGDVYKELKRRGLTDERASQGTAAIRAARRSMSTESFDKAMLVASMGTGSGWTPEYNEDGTVKEGTGAGAFREMVNKKMGADRQGAIAVLGAARQKAESRGRFDLVGGSFSEDAQLLEDTNPLNKNGRKMSSAQITEQVHRNALEGQSRNKLLNGHNRSLQALAPMMGAALSENVTGTKSSRDSQGNVVQQQIDGWSTDSAVEQYAFMAGALDSSGYAAPEMARQVQAQLSQKVDTGNMRGELRQLLESKGMVFDGRDITHADVLEKLRTDQKFGQYRREYGAAAEQDRIARGGGPGG